LIRRTIHISTNKSKEWIPIQKSGEKGGDEVSKKLKVLTMSLLVTIIMIVAFAGTAFAAGPNSGDCPNPDCPNADCPNPDCPYDGDGPKYQKGNAFQYKHQFSQQAD